ASRASLICSSVDGRPGLTSKPIDPALGTTSRKISSRFDYAHSRHIASRSVEACDEPQLDRISTDSEDNGNYVCSRLRRLRGNLAAGCNEDRNLTRDQFSGKPRQSVVLTFRPSVFNCYILAINIALFT